jgi:hypothetical protein
LDQDNNLNSKEKSIEESQNSENIENSSSLSVENKNELKSSISENRKIFIFILPLLILIYMGMGLLERKANNYYEDSDMSGFYESGDVKNMKSQSKFNILSQEDLSKGIKDTVYTTLDCWLELRINQQMLYQHFRNGKVVSYQISSGNKYLARSVESRPGLFAIFVKEAHHESSQYNNADMYHFMPFNQGIGFHSLNGTGYYGNLGKAPSSHGCIRMRHEDALKLFNDCPIGTLVLAHKGHSSRYVGFAPEGYKNEQEYSKEDFKTLLAANLYNILEGKYYVNERKYFVINPEIIPRSGVYIAYDKQIPQKQQLPKGTYKFALRSDKLNYEKLNYHFEINVKKGLETESGNEIMVSDNDKSGNSNSSNIDINLPLPKDELVKKFFNNPIGVLPYFPPENK